MAVQQGVDGTCAAAARAVHARHLMERAFRHEPLDRVSGLHDVNSRQCRDHKNHGRYAENEQLFT